MNQCKQMIKIAEKNKNEFPEKHFYRCSNDETLAQIWMASIPHKFFNLVFPTC